MAEADRALVKLSTDLNQVLIALNQGIVEAKLIAWLAAVEQQQNKITFILRQLHKKEVEGLINNLGIGIDKDKPMKEEKKEKKTSQLRGRVSNELAFHDEVLYRDYPSLAGVTTHPRLPANPERKRGDDRAFATGWRFRAGFCYPLACALV